MPSTSPRYHAFLLRVWQVESNGKLTWRASLESVHTGERHGFATPGLLFEFLKQLARHEDEHARQTTPTIKSD